MRQIYIYGFSGHGRVACDVALANGYDEVIFLDDAGELKFNPSLPKYDIFIAIGECATREKIQKRVLDHGFNVINLIHPSAVISPSAKFGKGVLVMPNAVINANASIGDGVIINSGAVVEHDCFVDEFSHICPRVALAGNVKIGKRVWIGIGSVVIQNINIKDDVFIGAASTVLKDIAKGHLAYGSPCVVIS